MEDLLFYTNYSNKVYCIPTTFFSMDIIVNRIYSSMRTFCLVHIDKPDVTICFEQDNEKELKKAIKDALILGEGAYYIEDNKVKTMNVLTPTFFVDSVRKNAVKFSFRHDSSDIPCSVVSNILPDLKLLNRVCQICGYTVDTIFDETALIDNPDVSMIILEDLRNKIFEYFDNLSYNRACYEMFQVKDIIKE